MARVLISIHAPREGCDKSGLCVYITLWLFQSTHPVRGATCSIVICDAAVVISIHAPREGCDGGKRMKKTSIKISIHAPREGCDLQLVRVVLESRISIHAPREGCDGKFC